MDGLEHAGGIGLRARRDGVRAAGDARADASVDFLDEHGQLVARALARNEERADGMRGCAGEGGHGC